MKTASSILTQIGNPIRTVAGSIDNIGGTVLNSTSNILNESIKSVVNVTKTLFPFGN